MSVRKHVLTITPGADHPQWQCPGPDHCVGWVECDQPHAVPGWGTADDPYDAPEGAPWEGYGEFEFHGLTHYWSEGGWRVRMQRGCVAQDNNVEPPEELWTTDTNGKPALTPGRYEIDVDWYDEHTPTARIVKEEA